MNVDVSILLERLGIRADRRGREWWACCPLHDERTPSFRIRDEPGADRHGFWQCLGACHDGGGPVGLVMRIQSVDADEARAWVRGAAAVADIERTSAEVVVTSPRAELRLPPTVEVAPLEEWPSVPRRYLADRLVTAAQVDRWGLGFATDGRLAHRVVVPVRDDRGRLRAYTARSYVGDRKKYLEADKAEGADKGAVFGAQHWPRWSAGRDRVYVAEGAFNALAIERALTAVGPGAFSMSYPAVAALQGSYLHLSHVSSLSTFAEVVIVADPDKAGDGLTADLVAGFVRTKRVLRARVPVGMDANDVERRSGRDALRAILDAAS